MIVNGIAHVIAALVGCGIAGVGVMLLVTELRTPPGHATHIYIAAGMMFFGALLIVPSAVTSGLRSVIVIVGPYIPVIGGRRAGDPPAPSGVTQIRRPIKPPVDE
jgi:hypothetical protein